MTQISEREYDRLFNLFRKSVEKNQDSILIPMYDHEWPSVERVITSFVQSQFAKKHEIINIVRNGTKYGCTVLEFRKQDSNTG